MSYVEFLLDLLNNPERSSSILSWHLIPLVLSKHCYSNFAVVVAVAVAVIVLAPMHESSSHVSFCDLFFRIDGYRMNIETLDFLYARHRAVSNPWRLETFWSIVYTEIVSLLVLDVIVLMEYL